MSAQRRTKPVEPDPEPVYGVFPNGQVRDLRQGYISFGGGVKADALALIASGT